MSPHTYRFCCNYDMDGEMLTVMRTDRGSLRLFEIETQGMVSKSKVLTNNNCEKKIIQLNSIISWSWPSTHWCILFSYPDLSVFGNDILLICVWCDFKFA